MHWMTYWRPWPKVTAVPLININLLVCRIKWEPLNRSLQNLVAISLWSYLTPNEMLEEFCWKISFCKIFFKKLGIIFQGCTLYRAYLRNGWSDWCETKRGCISWILGALCDIDLCPHPWPWLCSFKVKVWNSLIWGMGGWLTWNEKDVSRSFMTMTVTYG